jgi:hypothetical protein
MLPSRNQVAKTMLAALKFHTVTTTSSLICLYSEKNGITDKTNLTENKRFLQTVKIQRARCNVKMQRERQRSINFRQADRNQTQFSSRKQRVARLEFYQSTQATQELARYSSN